MQTQYQSKRIYQNKKILIDEKANLTYSLYLTINFIVCDLPVQLTLAK